MIELMTTLATCIARSGGTAFPMALDIVVGLCPSNENQSGKVCIRAASCGVKGRPGFAEGWVNRPCPFERKPAVIVEEGSSHFMRP